MNTHLKKKSINIQDANLYSIAMFAVLTYIVGGGASGSIISFLIICLSASIMLFFSLQGGAWQNLKSLPLVHRIALIAPFTLMIIQILPLPLAINDMSDIFGVRGQIYGYAGIGDNWSSISISPIDTIRAAILTFSMIIFSVSVMNLKSDDVYKLLLFITIAVSLSLIIGSLQFLVRSPLLKFYDISHDASLIGFFANKNHMALIIACISLVVYAQIVRISSVGKGALLLGLFAACAMLELATNSRAGLFLMFMAAIFMSLRHWHERRYMIALVILSIAILSMVSVKFIAPIGAMWERIGGATEDGRWIIFARSSELIDYVWPMGSGVGTFSKAFNAFEKLDWVNPLYVNSAHNDYIEYIVEGGVLSLIVMAVIFISFTMICIKLNIIRVFGQNKRSDDLVFISISIIFLFGLHSIVDYPLRRPASALLFFLGLGIAYRALTLRGRLFETPIN